MVIPTSIAPKVFISYRRADSIAETGRIYDQLVADFGPGAVFKDVDSIPVGSDFPAVIADAVKRCPVVLVVIGLHWLDAADAAGRRLDDPTDFVRLEIEAGLQRAACVIPVY